MNEDLVRRITEEEKSNRSRNQLKIKRMVSLGDTGLLNVKENQKLLKEKYLRKTKYYCYFKNRVFSVKNYWILAQILEYNSKLKKEEILERLESGVHYLSNIEENLKLSEGGLFKNPYFDSQKAINDRRVRN